MTKDEQILRMIANYENLIIIAEEYLKGMNTPYRITDVENVFVRDNKVCALTIDWNSYEIPFEYLFKHIAKEIDDD